MDPSHTPITGNGHPPAERQGWRPLAARAVYLLGLVAAASYLVRGLVRLPEGQWANVGTGIAFALFFWWIAAGIGVRLGTRPSAFFAWLADAIGLR